jgi:hypothetical protein
MIAQFQPNDGLDKTIYERVLGKKNRVKRNQYDEATNLDDSQLQFKVLQMMNDVRNIS